MRITGMESTSLFTGSAGRPLQIIRVTVEGTPDDQPGGTPGSLLVGGPGIGSAGPFSLEMPAPGQSRTADIGVAVGDQHRPGTQAPVTVIAQAGAARAEHSAMITVAEPGWTMWMVSHFHYDPVWWSTQGQFTEARLVLPDADGSLPDSRTAFELVRLHLEKARRDPDYKFVLAEIDYLKPHFDAYPQDRALTCSRCMADGPDRDRRRHLQRAEHQPDRRRGPPSATPSTASASSATCSAATRARRGCWTRSGTIPASPG